MANITNNKRKKSSQERMFRALYKLIQTKRLTDISVSELCNLAKINRTTFYNHYDNVNALAKDARQNIINEFAHQFTGNSEGYTPDNLLIMFRHFYHNQIVYQIYFQLNPSYDEMLGVYDKELAKRHYPGQNDELMRYHAEFFAAGMTAIIRRWLNNGCKETPKTMVKIITTEYNGKTF